MIKKEGDFSQISYVFGVLSVVFSIISYILGIILTPLLSILPLTLGLGFGLVGVILIRKEKTELSKRARKLNIIGIVLSILGFVFLLVTFYLIIKQILSNLQPSLI